jgi:hypothetical protein
MLDGGLMRSAVAVIVAVRVLVPTGTAVAQQNPTVEVYKTPTCGCCNKWVEHLRAHGFAVRTTDVANLADIKARQRVPPHVQSCHTAVVNGYVVEGHVPARDVRRLLTERAAVAGLAVAGMPTGSPGMEVSGRAPQPYNVLAFDSHGRTEVFASYNH